MASISGGVFTSNQCQKLEAMALGSHLRITRRETTPQMSFYVANLSQATDLSYLAISSEAGVIEANMQRSLRAKRWLVADLTNGERRIPRSGGEASTTKGYVHVYGR
jgi:hypothetical protein